MDFEDLLTAGILLTAWGALLRTPVGTVREFMCLLPFWLSLGAINTVVFGYLLHPYAAVFLSTFIRLLEEFLFRKTREVPLLVSTPPSEAVG